MKYASDDGKKIFSTQEECHKYEQKIKEEKILKEEIRQNKLKSINKKYDELKQLISEYEEEYKVKEEVYFIPFYDLVNMLCE